MSNNCLPVITPELLKQSDQELIATVLEIMRFPYKTWGTYGPTKPFAAFIKAWQEGEITWDPESASNVLEMDSSVVTVRWEINDTVRELREKYREFKNGHTQKRDTFTGSLAETMKHGETAYAAAIRGLAEELGQTKKGFFDSSKFTLEHIGNETLAPQPFPTYPPFQIIFNRKLFVCKIDERLYEEEYVCQEPDKTTYFGWIDIKP